MRLPALLALAAGFAYGQAISLPSNPTNTPNQVNVTTAWLYSNKMSYQGVWSAAVTYNAEDLVIYSGASYVSLQAANANNTPSMAPTWWVALPGSGGGSPGGSGFQVQYNNSGAFGGVGFGTAGQVLISNGNSGAPVFADPIVSQADATLLNGTMRIKGGAGTAIDAAPGATAPANAIQVEGTDGTNGRALLTDASGRIVPNGAICQKTGTISVTSSGGSGLGANFDNRTLNCNTWTLNWYTTQNASAVNIELDVAADNSGAPTSFITAPGSVAPFFNPSLVNAVGNIIISELVPWLRANVTAAVGTCSGGSPCIITYTLLGWNTPPQPLSSNTVTYGPLSLSTISSTQHWATFGYPCLSIELQSPAAGTTTLTTSNDVTGAYATAIASLSGGSSSYNAYSIAGAQFLNISSTSATGTLWLALGSGCQSATITQGGNAATVSAGGALKVDNSANTQPISGTVTANQGGAPWTATVQGATTGGATPYSYISAASANQDSQVVKASAGTVYSMTFVNVSGGIRYVKLYNASSGPTSASTPVLRFAVPFVASNVGGNNWTVGLPGIAFSTGISLRITQAEADNDATAAAANDVIVNLTYN